MDFSFKNLIPTFDWKYFSSLSILVFAVGGCEKISPYVNKVEDPSRGFPKSMILRLSWLSFVLSLVQSQWV